MDDKVNRRLMVGFATNIVSKASGTLVQLVQVPFMLHFWGKTQYGVWLLLTAFPAYLSFSNVGFGSVAGNEMTMLMARGEKDAALRVFQSCWWLISILMGLIGALFSLALWLLPMARLLRLEEISEHDTSWALFWLGIAVLFNQLETLLQASYRCIARYSYGNFLKSALTILAFCVQMVPIGMGYGIRTTAEVFAIANMSITALLMILVRHDIPWISYGWRHASFVEIRRLTRPSIAFMGFPIGQSLNLQGSQFAVNYALGAEAVTIFSTARTVSRLALQAVELVKNTVWPELSIAFGAGNVDLVRRLHRRACQIALFLSLAVMVVVGAIGPQFLHHWTLGKVPADMKLIALLLLVVVLYSLWSTSAVLVSAINQHERLATVYTLATGVTVVVTYFAARAGGLYGAAASLMLAEVVMDVYVLPASLKISHDTWPGFLRAVVQWPASLRPAALVRRLRHLREPAPDSGLDA
jgi:O-antigen/teichoic acid export membrane protein